MVHQFKCFISLEAAKTYLILIQIEENWVLWLKLVANRIYLSAPFQPALEPQNNSGLLPYLRLRHIAMTLSSEIGILAVPNPPLRLT